VIARFAANCRAATMCQVRGRVNPPGWSLGWRLTPGDPKMSFTRIRKAADARAAAAGVWITVMRWS